MSRTRSVVLAAASVLALAGLAGCSDPSTDLPQVEVNAEGVPVVPPEVGHVHGLAVNPADGLLYLGTHAGTLVIDDDSITRVGDSTIDLMGFTGAGPDHFFASGHPGATDDLPNPVGLIESTDGARTWKQVSLTGEADFHTLGAARGRVVGFTGELLSSDDGRDWTPGAEDVAPASLAVDPGDSTRIIATTEHGPARSTDAASTFTHLDGAPLLLLVSWPAPEALWGVSVDGTVFRSTDGGTTWTERGDVAAPTAFTVGADGSVVVATETQILTSRDGGESFDPVAEISGGGH